MDFELSDRQRHWRDRVRDFIDRQGVHALAIETN